MNETDFTLGLRVLACPMPRDDTSGSGSRIVGDFLLGLLELILEQEECFDGKRPFGNSGWKVDLEQALMENGLLDGSEKSRSECVIECDRLLGLGVLALGDCIQLGGQVIDDMHRNMGAAIRQPKPAHETDGS